jgi:hypothetical protein
MNSNLALLSSSYFFFFSSSSLFFFPLLLSTFSFHFHDIPFSYVPIHVFDDSSVSQTPQLPSIHAQGLPYSLQISTLLVSLPSFFNTDQFFSTKCFFGLHCKKFLSTLCQSLFNLFMLLFKQFDFVVILLL